MLIIGTKIKKKIIFPRSKKILNRNSLKMSGGFKNFLTRFKKRAGGKWILLQVGAAINMKY